MRCVTVRSAWNRRGLKSDIKVLFDTFSFKKKYDYIFPLITARVPAHHKRGRTEAMEDGYWDRFWDTGAPEFYLLRKKDGGENPEQETRTR